ncbi:non-specific serine/threonine protein kinase [Malassezia yamatoensis]|uniref:non-specific serine/threonine protein kinase n=1 Tax=Malassezia yamatoensis TaxID=253288 RepID=A0AAJ5YV11_9BASI|nr:non-specific serine/threonine protein kinase [Malassezia yamatoensis]
MRADEDSEQDAKEFDWDFDQDNEQAELKRMEERRRRRREILAKHEKDTQIDSNDLTLKKEAGSVDALREANAMHKEVAANSPDTNGLKPLQRDQSPTDDFRQTKPRRRHDDDALDDMFNLQDTPPFSKRVRINQDSSAFSTARSAPEAHAEGMGLRDNWDDADGYYRVILGEKLNSGRYQVFSILGRGMFSGVVRARDLKEKGREVAIKIVRSQETMYKAGMKEIANLSHLHTRDPEDKKHVVRLYEHFMHRGHLCMVFESLHLNLREIVKRFGKDVGLSLEAVRTYTQQMLLALAFLREENLIHADIKPDNIMVNESKTLLKLCDLGSASNTRDMEITPYLVSRFYRAPEIILGQPFGCEIDMWSMGCTIYELATGHILFPGKTNNHMLLLMQQLKGRPTSKQLRKCHFAPQYFEDHLFLSREVEKSSGEELLRRVNTSQPIETLRMRMLPENTSKHLGADELRQTQHLIDLLNRMLDWDPSKRLTPFEALQHAFVR